MLFYYNIIISYLLISHYFVWIVNKDDKRYKIKKSVLIQFCSGCLALDILFVVPKIRFIMVCAYILHIILKILLLYNFNHTASWVYYLTTPMSWIDFWGISVTGNSIVFFMCVLLVT